MWDIKRWQEIKVDYQGIRMFLTEVLEGIKWEDPFYTAFAKAMELIWECSVCKRIPCVCD